MLGYKVVPSVEYAAAEDLMRQLRRLYMVGA